ncbi:MAG: DUF2190 domain-containing protein [Alphaproteobacteria bacterium]|nr:MAG: DUF2190 domain-containing protein [Alphaproteobacteria bacterium]
MSRVLVKSFRATGAIGFRRLVAARTGAGSSDREVVQAAATSDPIIGVCLNETGAVAGEVVNVLMIGWEPVKLGGTVTRGQLLTSDASGRAIAAAATNRVVGIAQASGVADDEIDILLSPGAV